MSSVYQLFRQHCQSDDTIDTSADISEDIFESCGPHR